MTKVDISVFHMINKARVQAWRRHTLSYHL